MNIYKKKFNKIKWGLLSIMSAFQIIPVYAATTFTPDAEFDTSLETASTLKDVAAFALGLCLEILKYAGAVILIWGFLQFALSLKSDNNDQKSNSLMVIFTGVILYVFRSLLADSGIITG